MGSGICTYAAYAKDTKLRLQSSSGAMIPLLAHFVLERKGVVYGVAMSEDCYAAEYTRVETIEELKRIQGSKYIQAKVGDTFKNVKQDLLDKRLVLFTGTGCQVNGLKKYLMHDYEHLLCVDIICHGTPSPRVWKDYAQYMEKKYRSKLVEVSFRNKERYKWDGFEMKEEMSDKKSLYLSRHTDLYFSLFVNNITLRPSCYQCKARNFRLSDCTVADFWGIDRVAPELNDGQGTSLVIVRTTKGLDFFNAIKQNIVFQEVTYEDGVSGNKAEYSSYEMPDNRNAFFNDYNDMPFNKVAKKYLAVSPIRRVGRFLKRVLKIARGGVINKQEEYGIKYVFKE